MSNRELLRTATRILRNAGYKSTVVQSRQFKVRFVDTQGRRHTFSVFRSRGDPNTLHVVKRELRHLLRKMAESGG